MLTYHWRRGRSVVSCYVKLQEMEKFTWSANLNMSEIWCFSSPIVAVEVGEAATEKVRPSLAVRIKENTTQRNPVTSRQFAYQVPRPSFTLSFHALFSFLKIQNR